MTPVSGPVSGPVSTPAPAAAPTGRATLQRRLHGKLRYVVALAVCVGAIIWMITSLSANINYLETVSDAVKHRSANAHRELRIGGVVVRGTVHRLADGTSFKLSDGKATVFVHVRDIPSKLFADCAPVVVQGTWNGNDFAGDNLLVRHGANYGPSTKDAKHLSAVDNALAGTGCAKAS